MKRIIIALLFVLPCISQAQSGLLEKIKNKAKQKAGQRVLNKADKEIDKTLDEVVSQKRAASVKQSLVGEYGIEDARIETDGKGEKEPVSDNKTREGKAQNRRVEFIKQNQLSII